MSALDASNNPPLVSGSQITNRYDQLLAAVEASMIGVWEWNAVTGETSFNDMWYRMLGLQPGELPGHVDSWVDLVHPEDRERTFADLEAYLGGKTDGYLNVHRLRHKLGHWVWVRDCGLTTQRTAAGEPHILVGTHVDISDLKEAETMHRAAMERAEASERAKNRFLANMSHELRTPMTGILGLSELLLDSTLNDEDRRHTETLHESAQALHRLLNDLLELTVLESGPTAFLNDPFCWRRLVEEEMELYSRIACEKGVEVRLEKSGGAGTWARGDRGRVRQILSNLLSNALKFTTRNSSVVVSLVTESIPSGDLEITLRVADEGPGVPEGEMEAIFERFHQVRPPFGVTKGGGTGLGLAIARTIVEAMEGSLVVASTSPSGAIFELKLVLPSGEGMNSSKRPPVLMPAWTRPPRILVVDDVEVMRELVKVHLTVLGCEYVLIEDGDLVADTMAQEGPFDLILMDCEMPRLDGYLATESLRERGEGLPVIALSAHALPEHFQRCSAVGMSGYLVKPFKRREVGDILQRFLPHLGRESLE